MRHAVKLNASRKAQVRTFLAFSLEMLNDPIDLSVVDMPRGCLEIQIKEANIGAIDNNIKLFL